MKTRAAVAVAAGKPLEIMEVDLEGPREGEVLALMAEGRSNPEIAAALVVSDAAVAKHVANIFAKLDLPPEEGNRRVRAILTYLMER